MKKITLFLISVSFLSITTIAQVTQTKMALVSKKTATWCNPCGTWGWTAQDEIYLANNSNAVILQVHNSTSSVLNSSIATELQNNFPNCNYTPAWYVNGINRTHKTSSGIFLNQTKANIKTAVDSTSASPVLANCSYTKTVSGYNLTVNTITKFFMDTVGEYYLSVLLVEDDVVAFQNGIGNSAHHTSVLRGSMSTSVFGEMITSGSIAADTTFAITFTKTLDASWRLKNVTLALVIWEKVGTDYFYINAYKNGLPVGLKKSLTNVSNNFSIFPNPASDVISIRCSFPMGKETLISIYNMQGQLLLQNKSQQELTNLNIASLSKGVYFIRLESDNTTEVLRFVKN